MDDVVIKIGASSKQFSEELDKVKDKTESLEGQLGSIGKTAGLSFAALSASIGVAVSAFRESEQIAFQTENILKATGSAAGVTANMLDELSTSISRNTTADDEAVKAAGNLLLSFRNLGKDVFPQTLQAATDLAAFMGQDLQSATQLLGKALNDPIKGMQQLARAGISFTESQKDQAAAMLRAGDLFGAQNVILKEVEGKFKGAAAAAAQGTGVFIQLKNEVGNLAEEFGKHFAPPLIAAAAKLKDFVIWIQEHPQLIKFGAAVVVGATAVTGLTAALSAAGLAFIHIRATMIAAGIAADAMKLGVMGLMGATGIGLIVVGLSYLAMNWDTAWPRMLNVFKGFVTAFMGMAGGVNDMIGGMATADATRFKTGWAKVGAAAKAGWNQGFASVNTEVFGPEAPDPKQKKHNKADIQAMAGDDTKGKAAEELAKKQREHEDKVALILIQNEELHKLEKEAQDISNLLAEETNVTQRELLQDRLATNFALQDEAMAMDYEQKATFQEQMLLKDEEYQAMSDAQKAAFIARNQQMLQKEILTEKMARDAAIKDRLKAQLESNKQYLEEKEKFNAGYAALAQWLRDTDIGKSVTYFTTMQKMTSSHNAVLKGIGKAAALTQIAIDTAKGAMQALTAFPIPFIGPALGMAAAAAIIAFGIEQGASVMAANKGGMYSGGIPGMDSIPALYTPGEIVAPEKSFDEVVEGVAAQRGWTAPGTSPAGAGGNVRVMIEMSRDASRLITARQIEDRDLGLSREG